MDLGAIVQLGDCEAASGGWLDQPVNAWSSLAFALVGITIALSAGAATGRERIDRLVFGSLLVATGAGSYLFHGGAGGQFIHDASFLLALWFLVATNLTALRNDGTPTTYLVVGSGFVAIPLVLVAASGVANLITGVLAVGLVASDILLRRKVSPTTAWYGVALASLLVGLVLFAAGRTDSPLCDPHGVLQAHAGWHAFAAIFLGAYFIATEPARTSRVTV